MRSSLGIFLIAIFVVGVLAAPTPVSDDQASESRPKRGTFGDAIGMGKMAGQAGCVMGGDAAKKMTDHAKPAPGGGVFSDSVDAGANYCADQAEAAGNAAGEAADAIEDGKVKEESEEE